MKIFFLILISSCFFSLQTWAQSSNIFVDLKAWSSKGGKVHLYQDAETKLLLNDFSDAKKKEEGMKGFRVQIFFGSGHVARENANKIRNEFVSTYKDIAAHVLFEEPNFKVRVGDFRSKSEALKVLVEIRLKYKGAYIVTDFIEFPEFKE